MPAVGPSENLNPFLALHREMNRISDDFARGFDLPAASNGWSAGWPNVEVSETDKELRVVPELLGLEERDIEVTLHDGMLTLKGEKKSESPGAVYKRALARSVRARCSSAPMSIPTRLPRHSRTVF
jgi:HSP20 family protein